MLSSMFFGKSRKLARRFVVGVNRERACVDCGGRSDDFIVGLAICVDAEAFGKQRSLFFGVGGGDSHCWWVLLLVAICFLVQKGCSCSLWPLEDAWIDGCVATSECLVVVDPSSLVEKVAAVKLEARVANRIEEAKETSMVE